MNNQPFDPPDITQEVALVEDQVITAVFPAVTAFDEADMVTVGTIGVESANLTIKEVESLTVAPPAFIQVSVYVCVPTGSAGVVMAPLTSTETGNEDMPPMKFVIVQEVAPLDVQLTVAVPPTNNGALVGTDVTCTDNGTVSLGFQVTVTDLVSVPPGPVQEIVYVLVPGLISVPVCHVPELPATFIHVVGPVLVQEVISPDAFQVKVVFWLTLIGLGDADIVTVGAAVGTVTVTVTEAVAGIAPLAP
jgi:hypothetical protein